MIKTMDLIWTAAAEHRPFGWLNLHVNAIKSSCFIIRYLRQLAKTVIFQPKRYCYLWFSMLLSFTFSMSKCYLTHCFSVKLTAVALEFVQTSVTVLWSNSFHLRGVVTFQSCRLFGNDIDNLKYVRKYYSWHYIIK